jgi:hypothetical protein
VAGLLLFRLLYYLVPFGLSVAILGAREIWLAARRDRNGGRSARDTNNPDAPMR